MHFIEPLESGTWFRTIDSLSHRSRRSAGDLEEQLRHAYHLAQMAPLPIREVVQPKCDEVRFEQFLACGAFESAALALIPAPLKYSVARGYDTMVLATVALPGDDTGNFASAEEFASALLQAWVRSVMALQPQSAGGLFPEGAAETDADWPWAQMDGFRRSARP